MEVLQRLFVNKSYLFQVAIPQKILEFGFWYKPIWSLWLPNDVDAVGSSSKTDSWYLGSSLKRETCRDGQKMLLIGVVRVGDRWAL